jgi:S1 RNA binding domain protein
VGTIVEGKVKSIAPFGAFVDLGQGTTGLVHISEVSLDYVQNINEYLKAGDTVRVKVVSLDKGKINLSIKKVLEEEKKRTSRPVDIDWSRNQAPKLSFEDMLSKFKQESDEKIQSLKTNKESRKTRNY